MELEPYKDIKDLSGGNITFNESTGGWKYRHDNRWYIT
jgi:hypothetical protein